MMEYKETKKRMFYEGVELASFSAYCPLVDSEKITEFYTFAVQRSLEWFVSHLFEEEKEKYIADTDPSKRFSHKPLRYFLRFDAIYVKDGFLGVKNFAVLKRGSQGEICKFCDSQIWDLSEEVMLAPIQALKMIDPEVLKALKKRKIRAVFFENGEVYILEGTEWEKVNAIND